MKYCNFTAAGVKCLYLYVCVRVSFFIISFIYFFFFSYIEFILVSWKTGAIITRTHLFKYIENFTTQKGKFSDKKF